MSCITISIVRVIVIIVIIIVMATVIAIVKVMVVMIVGSSRTAAHELVPCLANLSGWPEPDCCHDGGHRAEANPPEHGRANKVCK